MRHAGAEPDTPPLDERWIRAELVRLLYRNAGAALLVNLFNAGLLVLALADIVGAPLLLWLVALLVTTLGRAWLVRTYRRSGGTHADPDPWVKRYVAGAAVAGVLWGAAGVIIVLEGDMVHHAFAAFILGGMSAGAIATSAPVMAAYLSFALPALLPVAALFLLQGDRLHLIMGAMALVFAATLLATARHAGGLMRNALALQLRNARINAELSRHQEDLGRLVEARTAALAKANEALREREGELRAQAARLAEADSRKDEFLALLGHELRNPLAAIRNAVDLLGRREAGSDAEPDQVAGLIARQTGRLARLVDDLLDVARITRGAIQLHVANLPLDAAISDAVEAARPLIDERAHRLEVELPQRPLVVRADRVRLAQVVENLLVNAAKYTPPGGLIHLGASREGDEAVIRVRDTGIGIEAERLERIFEPFHRGADANGGLGLGLALVRKLVALHDGRVEARSGAPGTGSEFEVRLPASDGPVAPVLPVAPQKGVAPQDGRRILVVDDNRDVAESLSELLRIAGHAVQTAHDGLEAVAMAEQYRPEVVLLDIGMPRLDGFGACRRMRAQGWGKGMRIVALSGWGGDDDRRKTHEAGFDGHLVKPVEPAALLALLEESAASGGEARG